MKVVRSAWKLLVGIKDALVLVALLLFFGALAAALNARPGTRAITDGALVLNLDGALVEQLSPQDPFAAAIGGRVLRENRLRDLLTVLGRAERDAQVRAVVLDLDRFTGGYPASVAELGRAIGRVRATGKPVLAYATAYTDSAYLIAANASEIWVDPLGGAAITGPGGSQLYFKNLLDRLGITANIYRVGRYKSAVEPFERADASPPAEEAQRALYGALFAQYRDNVARARPKARIDAFLADPTAAILSAGGDVARATLSYRLVDRLGDRLVFERRVAQLAGADTAATAELPYRAIRSDAYLAANPVTAPAAGGVGVLTVAGNIVDGEADPGTAGGDTIAELLADGLRTRNLKALVLRVDSPGGSVLASERIRQAVLAAKARGLPVVVSMGGLAASGGYYVATAGDTIFAEPNTITGSIGVFAVLPSFENALPKIGITTDGFATTPLSGQPDLFGGTNEAFDRVTQAGVESFYRRFVGLVAHARRMSPAAVDRIAQGRVWDGGSARQLGLVDRFGSLADAVAEAGRRAGLQPDAITPVYLEPEPGWLAKLLTGWATSGGSQERAALDLPGRMAAAQRALAVGALGDARLLATGSALQARCLECRAMGTPAAAPEDWHLLDALMERWLG